MHLPLFVCTHCHFVCSSMPFYLCLPAILYAVPPPPTFALLKHCLPAYHPSWSFSSLHAWLPMPFTPFFHTPPPGFSHLPTQHPSLSLSILSLFPIYLWDRQDMPAQDRLDLHLDFPFLSPLPSPSLPLCHSSPPPAALYAFLCLPDLPDYLFTLFTCACDMPACSPHLAFGLIFI